MLSKQELLGMRRVMDNILPRLRKTYIALEATRRHCPEVYVESLAKFKADLWEELAGHCPDASRKDMDGYASFLLEALAVRYKHEHIPASPAELKAMLDRGRESLRLDALLAPLPNRR